jgi:hypothetical protein
MERYIIALAYCYLRFGPDCYQWQSADCIDQKKAMALMAKANNSPKYIVDMVMSATA